MQGAGRHVCEVGNRNDPGRRAGGGRGPGRAKDIISDPCPDFNGERFEADVYLAMSRVVCRDSCPKIREYRKTAAFEEAGQAAKSTELLGEVPTDSTRSLKVRVEAENDVMMGKADMPSTSRH